LDLVPDDMHQDICNDMLKRLNCQGSVYRISAATGEGTQELVYALMNAIEERRLRESEDPEFKAQQEALRQLLEEEAREQVQHEKTQRRLQRHAAVEDDDNDDDHDMEIIYST